MPADFLDEAGVSTIPGSGFGESTRRYVRLGLTHPVHVLANAFDRIEYIGTGDTRE
ncbi:MAG: hypothetical protein U5O39_12630 [Gammaproteobacteria bacterium]|nr:hypothetical protein [Gammaproteobacteria bacterium]